MPVKKRVTKKSGATVSNETSQPNESQNSPEDAETKQVEATNSFDEHVLLQLPMKSNQLDSLLKTEEMQGILEYIPEIKDPEPYVPQNNFASENDILMQEVTQQQTVSNSTATKSQSVVEPNTVVKKNKICFWCCHEVGPMMYGMPIRYDALSKSFTMYGNFCSLECAAAHNFSVHLGSDRAWEIHSWIQMLGKRYGFKEPIRPAPSRYLLNMFDGPLSIDEFRSAHKGQARTFVMNIPPLISVNSQLEVMNTSFLGNTEPVTEKASKKSADKRKLETI